MINMILYLLLALIDLVIVWILWKMQANSKALLADLDRRDREINCIIHQINRCRKTDVAFLKTKIKELENQ